ncbi:MAG: ABC transporter ATP-binding protein/permease [Clostridia bacterium]|nr:ABC transporter ATP-binding protein/permease [Clostridia bacterium]
MLALKNVVKDYYVASETVHALKGVSINFRKSEFVSILGPSGCGKTTLLNIIGGLDRYTSGDLVINGKSTKLYTDRDWDVYRNHRIGFIFQSYNLIPHQTVLGNVELALTIAGIGKEERIRRSKQALDRVGLKDQYYKKPNQLSGGQCQRVAIARALVNDPEILLADEPTGALDTVTSVQIMELIKEISKERLVIMVTHNPELADKYSTRIVRMLDGNLIEDTMPYQDEDERAELIASEEVPTEKPKSKKEKAKMSFFTAFKLSARNLISKKGRTTMVGFAGSIGIIGIALVLAFSAGIKGYVASMQDDMLSGNPITITESTYDLDALTGMMSDSQKQEIIKEPNRVYINSMVDYFIKMGKVSDSMLIKNNITSDYVDYVKAMPSDYYSAMKYGYGINVHNNIYTSVNMSDIGVKNLSLTALTATYTDILKRTSFEEYANYVNMFIPSLEQAPTSEEYIKQQYEVHGKVATQKDEIMLVINKESEVSDLLLAMLGYFSQDEFVNLVYKGDCDCKLTNGSHDQDCKYGQNLQNGTNLDRTYFTYEEILSENKTFYWYPNSKTYKKSGFSYVYNSEVGEGWNEDTSAVKLKVVGILQPKQSVSYGCLSSGVYYTEALTNHILSVTKAEENGLVDFINGVDETTEMGAGTIYMLSGMLKDNGQGVSYTINYRHEGQDYSEKQYLSLSSGGGMLSMMMGGTTTPTDIKNGIIRTLGGNDIANSISIYPIDFDSKDLVTNYLDRWNGDETITVNGTSIVKGSRDDVKYTDTLSLVINLINTMIDVISYALIAFTSVSLVVSTVMIGIITYVSVVERIKEIGVIRSLGGRKKDVSYLFNAETFIIGLLAGLIGIGATYLISEIINLILFPLIGIRRIAMLPVTDAILMVLLSVGLTLISGLIPAKSAANKDPVIALRTE